MLLGWHSLHQWLGQIPIRQHIFNIPTCWALAASRSRLYFLWIGLPQFYSDCVMCSFSLWFPPYQRSWTRFSHVGQPPPPSLSVAVQQQVTKSLACCTTVWMTDNYPEYGDKDRMKIPCLCLFTLSSSPVLYFCWGPDCCAVSALLCCRVAVVTSLWECAFRVPSSNTVLSHCAVWTIASSMFAPSKHSCL